MKKSKIPLLIITAGGTGGHIYPAQALIEELLKNNWRVKVFTDKRGFKYFKEIDRQVELSIISSAALNGSNIIKKISALFKLFKGTCVAGFYMIIERPTIIVGFGGYPTVAPIIAAFIGRNIIVLHEQNAVLGRANKWLSCVAHIIATSFELTEKLNDNYSKTITVGNPVRKEMKKARLSAYPIIKADTTINILVIAKMPVLTSMQHLAE